MKVRELIERITAAWGGTACATKRAPTGKRVGPKGLMRRANEPPRRLVATLRRLLHTGLGEGPSEIESQVAFSRPWARAVALVLVVGVSGTAGADEYRRVFKDDRGQPIPGPRDPTVCAIWGKNLNYFAKRNEPLSCARPIAPSLKALTRPNWSSLEPRDHIDLLRRLDRMLFYDLPPGMGREFIEEEWRRRLEERFAEGSVSLKVADLDLNGDGHPEKVLRYGDLPCEPRRGKPATSPGGSHYFVVDPSLTHLQRVNMLAQGAELVIYKGHVYAEWIGWTGTALLDEFYGGPLPSAPSICQMRFLPDKCPPNEHPRFGFGPACRFEFRLNGSTRGQQP